MYEQTLQTPRHFGGASSREIANGFSTRVQEYCARRGIDHGTVYPTTLKKFATGRGNAPKGAMLAAARERLGYRGLDDNEADALWILAWAREQYSLGGAASAAESHQDVRTP